MKRLPVLGLIVLVVASTLFAATYLMPEREVADPNNLEQVGLGMRVYAENCASCHGVALEGQPDWQIRKPDDRLPAPPHDDSGHTWHHADDVLFQITKHGVAKFAPPGYETDMPAFGDVLRDEEIWAVLAYIKTYWSKTNLQRQTMVSQRSKK